MEAAILTMVPGVVLGIIVVAGSIGLAIVGLLLVRRSVTLETLVAHQEVAGYIVNVVGVVYAVLLALVVIAVWEQFEGARAVTEREANAVASLYRLASALPRQDQAPVQDEIRSYTRLVVDEEWRAMQSGQASERAWDAVDSLWRRLLAVEPRSPRESAAYQEALARMDVLGDARRERLLASRQTLPTTLWWVLILGGIVTVGFTYFFGVERLAAQLLMTVALTAVIALVLFLILSLDLPFSGDVSVEPRAFVDALRMFDRISPR